jgi:hypothetical protein
MKDEAHHPWFRTWGFRNRGFWIDYRPVTHGVTAIPFRARVTERK